MFQRLATGHHTDPPRAHVKVQTHMQPVLITPFLNVSLGNTRPY